MTTQDPTTIENEVQTNENGVPAITQNEESAKSAKEVLQSTDSLEPASEQGEQQVDTAPEASQKEDPEDYPAPYPMDEELGDELDSINRFLAEVDTLIFLAYAEHTLVGRDMQLKEALTDIDHVRAGIERAIKLNACQKQVEDQNELEALAKRRNYRDWAEMRKALDGGKAGDSQTATQPAEKSNRNKKNREPFDYLLKEEFTASGEVDFKAGYRSGQRPYHLSNWYQEFVERHGYKPTTKHCRPATKAELEKQRLEYDPAKKT